MPGNNNKMMENIITSLYEYEINVNRNIQKQFLYVEPILRNINDFLDPFHILNFWIPLVGIFNHKLLIELVTSLSLVNTLASVIKWCCPEYRPSWWIKEIPSSYKDYVTDIRIDPYNCDTSAGFPSTHVTTFTTFVLILLLNLKKSFFSSLDFTLIEKYMVIYAITSLLSAFLWFSRLYFLYEFLHQCVMSSLFAAGTIHVLNKRFSVTLINLGKVKASLMVIGFGLIPINAYFVMLYMDVDPFWSIRMAFKWCADPLHLKHESSPVFMLCRDFGYLLGVALSCPLAKSYTYAANNRIKRSSILLVVVILNAVAQAYTPKQYGRLVFVAYEFLRNCLHSLMLLNILPKFDTK